MQDQQFNLMGLTTAAGIVAERYEYTLYGVRQVFRPAGLDIAALLQRDINNDGIVDAADKAILDANLPTASGATRWMGDTNNDGDVDSSDESRIDDAIDMCAGNLDPRANAPASGSATVPYSGAKLSTIAFQGLRLDETTGLIDNRARIYDPLLQRFLQEDPLGYPDGANTYTPYHVLTGNLDPSGRVVIFVHGIRTENVSDIEIVYEQLRESWQGDDDQALIHFRYTRNGKPFNDLDAAGGVSRWDPSSPLGGWGLLGDGNYEAGRELAKLINHLDTEKSRIYAGQEVCREPIYLLAYSNGANVAYHAMNSFGAKVDKLIFIGASLDDRSSISEVLANNSTYFHNFYSDASWFTIGDAVTEYTVDGLGSDNVRADVLSRKDVTSQQVEQVHHSNGGGISATDTQRINGETAWLTKHMASEWYSWHMAYQGDRKLSRNGTLPGGTKLQVSRGFWYRMNMNVGMTWKDFTRNINISEGAYPPSIWTRSP